LVDEKGKLMVDWMGNLMAEAREYEWADMMGI